VAEARELLSWDMLLHLLVYAVLPLMLLWRVRIVERSWGRAILVRVGVIVSAAVVAVGALFSVFQPFSSLVRNHKEVRYLITPANYLWSIASATAGDATRAAQPRVPIGLDAAPGPSWTARTKPVVVVLVVGETVRAANWGLNGYARQTTPQLAKLGVTNFTEVSSCGTNTEVSLPCMFAPVGRRDYDEARIRGSESLLHVLARAGVAVHWRDNQSGCKGVCDGLPNDTVSSLNAPGLCQDGRCLDEGLIHDLDQRLATASGAQILVLHQLGNHGPSYFRRYPSAFAKFLPDCRDDDLRKCSVEEIVNAYDNAILYSDQMLASTIAKLNAHADKVDSVLLYVSDHGESLGEKGLFLHGVPYAIGPQEQTHVPMFMWWSSGFARGAGMSDSCLRATLEKRAHEKAAHDNLFHTVLGLLDVRTELHEASLDLVDGCRQASAS
jgi:lipid A ethanolaminephosphotransferase